jgi:Xaa-Pro aminopeptidase
VKRTDEVAAKLDTVRAWLDHNDLDAVLVSAQAGFAWITAGGDSTVTLGEEAGAASVLVTREDAYLLAANIELRRLIDEEAGGAGLTPVEWPWHEDEGESQIVERLCDPTRTVSDLGRLGLPVAPSDLTELRTTLLPAETDRYRRLGADAAEAVEVTCLTARPGDRETDVAAVLDHECRRRNITPLVNLVGVDERIACYRHPVPGDRRLERTLLVAVTGRRNGLHASLTRMVHHGAPDSDLLARHGAVTRVDARLIIESRAGAVLGEVFDGGLDQYQREGFATEWRLHHQGGLTGYAGREVFATSRAPQVLRAGQALAWNPSITGVKSEDTILISEDGPEILTATPAWPRVAVDLHGNGTPVERPALLYR